ncbi:phosphate acyltransferase [Vagococcus lutrae]|uniref:phosphate acyltransferase n=1 Tax=Vagococcus lutrae TaxID=81947 RepID=UPI001443B2E4|nr:phosphate acyltransferase [Vagococcus lutrae]MDT2808056.1 phosphate acyltransferase [Vagococcus lutrae]NKZ27998.1 phosphotransacetylase [Vagococcus lutrae]
MKTISVAGGSQPEILELVKEAHKRYPNELEFVVFDTNENIDNENLWRYEQCQDEKEMVFRAVSLVAKGEAQLLLKGIVQTHAILKEVLQKEHNLRDQKVLSHVAMVDIPKLNRTILLTDCGMNIAPDTETLSSIVDNAVGVAHKIGLTHPKVALLSAAENVNPKMPSSVLTKEVSDRYQNSENCTVYGPISLDLALSQEAVAHKKFEGPVAGDADILVVPSIDTGNCLYKSLTLFGDALVGGTIVGTKVPVILTSRSDKIESKLHSLSFALKQV